MTGNRVEQLESRVRELEATLNGLTDELVDTKDRLETVERALTDGDTPNRRTDIVEGELLGKGERDADGTDDGADTGDTEAQNDTATDAGTEGEIENGTETTESDTDGIIVA